MQCANKPKEGRGTAVLVAALLVAVLPVLTAPGQVLIFGAAAGVQSPAAVLAELQETEDVAVVRGPWRTEQPATEESLKGNAHKAEHTGEAAQAAGEKRTPKPGVNGLAASAAPSTKPTAQPMPTALPQPTAENTAEPNEQAPKDLPRGMGEISARTFRQGQGSGYVELERGSIQNDTQNSDAELREAARGGLPFSVERNSTEPQVLILHTHATECYQPWDALYFDPDFSCRSEDPVQNMCAVGAVMAQELNAAGICTLHDETPHDSPSYTQSYARSAQTARDYLEKYPSIQVILDVHRDALEQDNVRVKPLVQMQTGPAAQVMIICGCSNSASGGSIDLPHWRRNLQFAATWENGMETQFPGLTRPVLCAYRFYNQDLTTGSLLVEVGSHANTLAEATQGARLAARALAVVLQEG